MNIACLTPVYGMPKRMLENLLACFEHQMHPYRFLLFYDDLGNVEPQHGPNWHLESTDQRCSSLPGKYNFMLQMLEAVYPQWEAVAVMDCDDVYLPFHLRFAAELLKTHQAVYPDRILSAYFTPPRIEKTGGRFHGSLVVRRDLLEACGGWIESLRATFDQEMIELIKATAKSISIPPRPTYVYRWQSTDTFHCSGIMNDREWYAKTQPTTTERIGRLTPTFDDESTSLIRAWG